MRGLAILLMLLDHAAYVAGPAEVRMTVGRLAMPLFFVLAGAFATRLTDRQLLAGVIGLPLTAIAPWAGEPNILVQYALCAVVLVALQRVRVPLWVVVVLPLVFAANHWLWTPAGGYEMAALLGLMALGRLAGVGWAVRFGGWLPGWLAVIGARPLTWYVGNVLAVTVVLLWLSKG